MPAVSPKQRPETPKPTPPARTFEPVRSPAIELQDRLASAFAQGPNLTAANPASALFTLFVGAALAGALLSYSGL